jgi:hypothetical protein
MRQNTLASAVFVAVGALLCRGCTSALPQPAQSVLTNADSYTLMLIHRAAFDSDHRPATFHDCVVDKSVAIFDAGARRKLVTALKSGLSREGPTSLCMFMPRYGVHVVREQYVVDMEICFHCGQCMVYTVDDKGTLYSIDRGTKDALSTLITD